MSSPIIPIFVGSFGESVGSSISLVILSDAEPATVPAIILVVLLDATEVEVAVVASPVGVLDLVIHFASETDPFEDLPSSDHAPVVPIISPFLSDDHSESDSEYGPSKDSSEARPLPSVVEFNQLLTDVTKKKHFSSSVNLFNQMCAIGVPVSQYTMSIVINCCCHLYRSNDAFAVLGSCFKGNIVPHTAIFNTLLNGLVVESRILEAERFFAKEITNKLCEPNVIMYSTMIEGHCKTHDYVAANDLLKLMDGSGCKPDVVAYNTIIDSMCKHKMIEDAFKLLKQMVSQKEDEKKSSNVKTFNILVDALCKECKIEEAEAVIKIMPERDILPNIVTYTSLINGYCLQGEISKARTVFGSMVCRGLIPNIVTYMTLLNGYCKDLMIDEAMHMFQEITKQGHVPSELTYGIMLKGLCNNHQLEEALSLFIWMSGNKTDSLNIVVYNVLIDGAHKCRKPDIAKNLFDEVSVKGLQPDVYTYAAMIGCFGEEGLPKDAKELFLKMKECGCSPDYQTYNVLLHGCLKNQQYDDVKMLLVERMKEVTYFGLQLYHCYRVGSQTKYLMNLWLS
nr:hypothetical protein [Tanacetum cinerariifolium]